MSKKWKLFWTALTLGFLFLYSAFAFVLWQLEASEWSKDARAFFIFIYVGWIALSGVMASSPD